MMYSGDTSIDDVTMSPIGTRFKLDHLQAAWATHVSGVHVHLTSLQQLRILNTDTCGHHMELDSDLGVPLDLC